MEITNELLAAYAEGNVSDAERNAVREYLVKNPEELESVMMMMDMDFELTPIREPLANDHVFMNDVKPMEDICYSAAAFAPKCLSKNFIQPPKYKKRVFKDRLNDLLDEINL